MSQLPIVLADLPVCRTFTRLARDRVQLVPWESVGQIPRPDIVGIYTYGHPRVDASLLDRLPQLRVISNFGVGVDHIDLDLARARAIPVGYTPDLVSAATADMAFALLLAAGRRLVEGDYYARSKQFTRYDPSYMLGFEVHGATLGIFGLGRIGREVAKRARGFDMTILYHNRNRLPEAEAALGARYVSKNTLLAEADYVVLCVPLTDETRGLIGKSELAMMRPTSILVNVSRGPVVDTEALTQALIHREIYAAALDVTDPEPLPRDHLLLRLPNVILTPHLGSATEQTRRQMAERAFANLLAGLNGEPLLDRVV
ncbi:MAG: D-glycerate dehydrogenase [Gemmataceae bacterium]